jgi:hypothetical protein
VVASPLVVVAAAAAAAAVVVVVVAAADVVATPVLSPLLLTSRTPVHALFPIAARRCFRHPRRCPCLSCVVRQRRRRGRCIPRGVAFHPLLRDTHPRAAAGAGGVTARGDGGAGRQGRAARQATRVPSC